MNDECTDSLFVQIVLLTILSIPELLTSLIDAFSSTLQILPNYAIVFRNDLLTSVYYLTCCENGLLTIHQNLVSK